MTINIKNFLNEKSKLSKMGEFQNLKQIEGLEMSSVSADLYGNGRDDLSLFYFKNGANYATVSTSSTIRSESLSWNDNSHKNLIKQENLGSLGTWYKLRIGPFDDRSEAKRLCSSMRDEGLEGCIVVELE